MHRNPTDWRRVILQFFYALLDVKSNAPGAYLQGIAWLAIVAVLICGSAAAQEQLTIPEQNLPSFIAGAEFRAELRALGGAPPYVWTIASGELPEGISLSAQGCLCGRPAKPGTFTFTLKVEDSAHPPHSATKDFHTTVTGLMLEWLEPPKVRDSRVDGSVQVSNGSQDPFDLTLIIVAVSSDSQRATAIGYEHLTLKPGTSNLTIPFGSTLPRGGYTIHADAIAEIPARGSILRQRLQTAQPLSVLVGP